MQVPGARWFSSPPRQNLSERASLPFVTGCAWGLETRRGSHGVGNNLSDVQISEISSAMAARRAGHWRDSQCGYHCGVSDSVMLFSQRCSHWRGTNSRILIPARAAEAQCRSNRGSRGSLSPKRNVSLSGDLKLSPSLDVMRNGNFRSSIVKTGCEICQQS
jgi:hypothetical protein